MRLQIMVRSPLRSKVHPRYHLLPKFLRSQSSSHDQATPSRSVSLFPSLLRYAPPPRFR
ncbi:hypothetical protein LINGRAPRIM_LOCUS2421 [Linum grandiflorum]